MKKKTNKQKNKNKVREKQTCSLFPHKGVTNGVRKQTSNNLRGEGRRLEHSPPFFVFQHQHLAQNFIGRRGMTPERIISLNVFFFLVFFFFFLPCCIVTNAQTQFVGP